MRSEIVFVPSAVRELRDLAAPLGALIRDEIERHLRHQPRKESRSRIKRLRGLSQPQYRLRVGEQRVFYDVKSATVQVLTIVSKEQAGRWLEEEGTIDPGGTAGEGQG
jgi:mRNA-degrading endonuclease RelE of RelBE toxin-antitoxin system